MLAKPSSIAVIGGGAWGSAIASVLAPKYELRILTRRDDLAEALMQGRSPALKDQAITPPAYAGTDPARAISGTEAVVMSVPTRATEAMLAQIKPHLDPASPVAFAAKGFIPGADDIIPNVVASMLSNPLVMLSGPSFADEVVAGLPAALVAAAETQNAAETVANLFKATPIRVYSSTDPIGVAVGGAVKNVIAIACGITAGLGLGDNAQAALMTRGLAEAARLATAMGGRTETIFGLAGLGDMALTCSGSHSRNFAYGYNLGAGTPHPESLVEGQLSAAVIARRAEKHGIDMPITAAVARLVAQKTDIDAEIKALLARPPLKE